MPSILKVRTIDPGVLIVGAGITGLMTALALPERAFRLSIVDKGRSVGGRLATRRVGGGRADHGAQFFTARTEAFGKWVNQWEREGLVFTWARGWSDGISGSASEDGHPRFAATGGMNNLAKALADSATSSGTVVHTGVHLQAISCAAEGWWACSEDGRVYTAQALVLTAPVPQSLALLQEGDVDLSHEDHAALTRVHYAPCLCILLHFENEVMLPEPGALHRPDAAVPWIADNRRKGISDGATVITAHASPEFSTLHFEEDDERVIDAFFEVLAPLLSGAGAPIEVQVKRWRYARPTSLHGDRFLRAGGLPPLFFGGDAFGEPRIEGAALSGLAIAEAIRGLAMSEHTNSEAGSLPSQTAHNGGGSYEFSNRATATGPQVAATGQD